MGEPRQATIGENTKISLTGGVFLSLLTATVVITSSILGVYFNLKNQQDILMAQHKIMLKKIATIECRLVPEGIDCAVEKKPASGSTAMFNMTVAPESTTPQLVLKN